MNKSSQGHKIQLIHPTLALKPRFTNDEFNIPVILQSHRPLLSGFDREIARRYCNAYSNFLLQSFFAGER